MMRMPVSPASSSPRPGFDGVSAPRIAVGPGPETEAAEAILRGDAEPPLHVKRTGIGQRGPLRGHPPLEDLIRQRLPVIGRRPLLAGGIRDRAVRPQT